MKYSNNIPDHLKSWKYVFNSRNIFPADFMKCRETAKNVGYSLFGFNGNVYTIAAQDPSLDAVCPELELAGD